MRELLQINDFSKGIITIADSFDITNEACVYSENIDPSEGLLTPIKTSATITGATQIPSNASQSAFVTKDSDSYGMVYSCFETPNNKIKLIDEYTTAYTTAPTTLVSASDYTAQTSMMLPINKEVRLPRWGTVIPQIFQYYDSYQTARTNIDSIVVTNDETGIDTKERVHLKGAYTGSQGDTFTIQSRMFEVDGHTTGVPSADYVTFTYFGEAGTRPTTAAATDLILINAGIVEEVNGTTASVQVETDGVSLYFNYVAAGYSSGDLATITHIGFRLRAGTVPIMWKKNSGSWNVAAFSASYTTLSDGLSLAVSLPATFMPGFTLTYTVGTNWLFENLNLPYDSLAACTLSLTPTGTSSPYFLATKRYYYRLSFSYDLVQETLMYSTVVTTTTEADYNVIKVLVDNPDFTTFSRRITGINVYRAESLIADTTPTTLYRLVKSFDMTTPTPAFDGTTGRLLYTYSDYGNQGSTYESITGVPEDISVIIPNYTYGLYKDARLYIIGNYVADESESSRMLYMSQQFKYDMFNWDEDYVLLDGGLKGIGSFRSSIFVFGNNIIWRINPETLSVEQKYEGYNLLNQTTILTTEYGLIFATTTGVYSIDETGVNELSYAIRNKYGVNSGAGTVKCWTDFITSAIRLYSYYDDTKKSLVFFDSYSDTAFVYFIPTKSWWYWAFESGRADAQSCLVIDPSKNFYYSGNSTYKKLFNGTNYAALTWISKLITFDAIRQKKRLQKIKYKGSGAVTYAVDDSSSFISVPTDAGVVTFAYLESLQIKVSMTTGATRLIFKAIEIIYRAMKGLR